MCVRQRLKSVYASPLGPLFFNLLFIWFNASFRAQKFYANVKELEFNITVENISYHAHFLKIQQIQLNM